MDNFQLPTDPTADLVNSPEAETESTPAGFHPSRSRFPITNGLLRRFQPLRSQPSSPPRSVDTANYRECLRNHAASMGGLALDGCGGYIAPPSYDPSNPIDMECMVCGCHRNFHRIEKDDSPAPEYPYVHHIRHHHPVPPPLPTRVGQLIRPGCAPPSPFFPTYYPQSHHTVLSASELHNAYNIQSAMEAGIFGSKRRHRTKFSREQKVKMQELAEKLGWKMQKGEEEMIEAFCLEIGVERHVFKVWMHNKKCILGKRDATGNGAERSNEEDARDLLLLQLEGNDAITTTTTTTSPHENVANVSSSSSSELRQLNACRGGINNINY